MCVGVGVSMCKCNRSILHAQGTQLMTDKTYTTQVMITFLCIMYLDTQANGHSLRVLFTLSAHSFGGQLVTDSAVHRCKVLTNSSSWPLGSFSDWSWCSKHPRHFIVPVHKILNSRGTN